MRSTTPNRALLAFAAAVMCSAWTGAAVSWLRLGNAALAVSLFLLGVSLGPCLGVYALVRANRKLAARRTALVAGGLSIVAFSVLSTENLELEGCFLRLFQGVMGAAVGHTLVTVVVGPLLFGRFLCGWGCWRSMVLELLPIGRNRGGRRTGWWNLLPLGGLAASAGGAVLAVAMPRPASRWWPVPLGFGIYYAAAIGLAFALRDKRAFCKYLCPSAVILGMTSRLSVLKIKAERRLCNACGACSRICPMDINVAQFAVAGGRVLSGQCILCQRCVHACPTGALRMSAGLDVAGRTPFIGPQ